MKKMIAGFAFLCILQVSVFAQTTSTWTGGTPGKVADWNCSTNWKEGRVPDENTQVIIPSDLIYYPVIMSQVPDIDAMLVTGGAQLTILNGASLTILGESHRFDVLTNQGKIVNEGNLRIFSTENFPTDPWSSVHGNAIVRN